MPFYGTLISVTILRDLKGRIRLLLEFPEDPGNAGSDHLPANWQNQKIALEQLLAAELGTYWGGKLWRGRQRNDRVFSATADALRDARQPWQSGAPAGPVRWFKVERQFSKSSWGAIAAPPWPIADQAKPAIVAFYSFKGGVGRTVTLSSVALLLAQAGHSVVVVDLDIEAPGAAPFLMGATSLPDDGVVDYLVERQLNGVNPPTLAPYVSIQTDPALVHTSPIRVLPSGKVNAAFVEKVARLDFEGYVAQAQNPLAELLRQVAAEYQPAFILLDVRSGLHDLGGLSLNVLSHLNIVFSRDAEQAWAGLETVLTIQGEHRAAGHDSEILLVHSLVPPNEADAHERFMARSYQVFQDHYYTADDTMPDIASNDAPYGLCIPFQESLQNAVNAASLQPTTDCAGAFVKLTKRIGSSLGRHTV